MFDELLVSGPTAEMAHTRKPWSQHFRKNRARKCMPNDRGRAVGKRFRRQTGLDNPALRSLNK